MNPTNWNITKEHYRDADATFRAAYEQYTGIDPSDVGVGVFTAREQVERYARQFRLADHVGGGHATFDGMTSRDVAMWCIASRLLCAVRAKILTFPHEVQEAIGQRVRELPEPPNIGPARADARHYRRMRRQARGPSAVPMTSPEACERSREAHVAAVEANDAAERSEERRRELERSTMAAQERARRKALPERPLSARGAARPSQRSSKKAARSARRANTREPAAALEHEVFRLPEQRELRAERFDTKQAHEHADKLERKERERADALRAREREVSAAKEAAAHVVPLAPTIADFLDANSSSESS